MAECAAIRRAARCLPRCIPLWLLAAALAGCASSSPDSIPRDEAQRLSTVLDATVLSVRAVSVEGSQSGAGAAAGGVVGGVAGASVGGRRESVAVGVVGAVAGAVAGNLIERAATREDAVELLLQLRNGERRVVVQGRGAHSFQPGEAVVLVNTGGRVRVIPVQPAEPLRPAAVPAGG